MRHPAGAVSCFLIPAVAVQMLVETPAFGLKVPALYRAPAEKHPIFGSSPLLVLACLALANGPQVDDLAHRYFLRNASSETTWPDFPSSAPSAVVAASPPGFLPPADRPPEVFGFAACRGAGSTSATGTGAGGEDS